MTFDDIPTGMYLKDQAGWNQTETDWRRFIDLQPSGCFVAELNGSPVATASTCVLDSIGWIGMVLVDEPLRNQGIGTRMMEHCLAYLRDCGVGTARLDATPAGQVVYEKLGFEVDYEILRMEGIASAQDTHPDVESVQRNHLEAICSFDERIRGMKRHRFLESLYDHAPQRMRVVFSQGEVAGYLAHREGIAAIQIGPSVALSDSVGQGLADAALAQCAGRQVFMDIPTKNEAALAWARSRGLVVQRPLMRMHLGNPVNDDPFRQWASSGPEKG